MKDDLGLQVDMVKKEIAFIHNGEQVVSEVTPTVIPQIGEWVQLYTEQTYKTFVVKHVLHKFIRGMLHIKNPVHRFIIILEEIKE